jgi:hypothetical protein
MKSVLPGLAAVLACATLIFASTTVQKDKHRNITISTSDEDTISDCSQVSMEIGDAQMARSELSDSVPASAVSSLRVTAAKNGGIHVQGWDRAEYHIKACLAASGDTETAARELLSQIKLSLDNGQVTVIGPATNDWLAYLIVQAPKGAVLDLSSVNGPIGISDLSGTIDARNVNGPLTFSNVNGPVRGEVQNGPITVKGGGGDFSLKAQNGPLTVVLSEGASSRGGLKTGR